MKNLFLIACFLSAPCFAQGQLTEDAINQMGKNGERYSAGQPFEKTDWSVFDGQPRYNPDTPEMLNGFQLSTAGERGVTEAWNEVGQNIAVKVKLNPNEKVLYMGDVYYLDNCRWLIGGKWVDFKNRIKPIWPPPVPEQSPPPVTPQPAPVQEVVDVRLPEDIPPVPLNPMPPALGPPPSSDYVATLVWDHHGKSWVWKYTPLWCVDVRKLSDIYHPAVCGGLALGGWWLAGGFKAAVLIKGAIATIHW